MKYRVLIADAISASGLQPLAEDACFELVVQTGLKGEELARAIQGMAAVVVRSATSITRDALRYADELRVIGRAGVGVDNIDVDAATERGIAVLNAPSGNTISAAELTLALMLALARRVPAADASMKSGIWDRRSFSGSELLGKTLGLVGAGRIGGEVARRARAFGMKVVAFDPYLTAERAAALDVSLASFETVLAEADVLSLHVPLTEATAGLIGDAQLAQLRRGALLVNASRGGVLDEAALVRALESGQLGGAALDVYEQEPLPPDHPLRRAPNIVLTPHLGASTAEAQQNVALEIAHAVRAALLEGDFSHAVNAPAISGEEAYRLRPLVDLAERLGLLAAELLADPIRSVLVRYAGPGVSFARSVAAGAIAGALRQAVGSGGVNFVNALHLARARGITVECSELGAHGNGEEYIDVRLRGERGRELRVAGALVAGRHPRIVRIDRYRLVVRPAGTLLLVRNHDVPGVIGQVGTLLGRAGINIAEYHQARIRAGGEALAAVSVDARVDDVVLDALRALPEILEVRQVVL